MPEYKYGTYGEIVESIYNLGDSSQTIPVYFGTAPVQLVKGWKDKGLVNHPIKVKSLADAQKNVGYCDDFVNYTLCEAIAAHFDAGSDSVGPIYLINVLDPDINKQEVPQTETLNLIGGRALIKGTETIVDSVKIARQLPDDLAALPAQTVEFRGKGTGKGDKGFDYAKAYAEAGVKLQGTTLTYEPTGKIDEHILHDGYLVVGLKLTKPQGATHVTVKIDGQVADDNLDLAKEGDFVLGGELIEYIAVADATGKPLKDKHLEIECDWTGSETPKTSLLASTGDGAYYTPGEDYEISYNYLRGGVLIQDLTGNMTKTPIVTYDTVEPSQIDAVDVIGDVSVDGKLSGIEALKLLFMETGDIANLLAAPGWSGNPDVCAALSKAARKANGHWDAMYVVDIPLDDNGEKIDTLEKAVKWKAGHATGTQIGSENTEIYNDERSKVCWPMAQDAKGRVFHISTLCVAAMLRTDQENGGYPFETPGNKSVPIIKQYFGADSKNGGFDQRESDEICSKGITTVIPWATNWQLWGDHTAAYDYDNDDIDPRCIFDASMRMLMHITNSFQQEWALTIDEPMTRALVDTIINREQEKLDQLVSIGALLGKPTVMFVEEDNSHVDLVNGNFTWSITATPTPPLKSATVRVAYTDEGFSSYWGEE